MLEEHNTEEYRLTSKLIFLKKKFFFNVQEKIMPTKNYSLFKKQNNLYNSNKNIKTDIETYIHILYIKQIKSKSKIK